MNYRNILAPELLEQIDADIKQAAEDAKRGKKADIKTLAENILEYDKEGRQIALCLHIVNVNARKLNRERKKEGKKLYMLKGGAMKKLIKEGKLVYKGVHIVMKNNEGPQYHRYYEMHGYGFHDAVSKGDLMKLTAKEILGAIESVPTETTEAFAVEFETAVAVIRKYTYGN